MTINAWNQMTIQQAQSELDRIEAALSSYYDQDKSAFQGMRADFDMDGTSEEMEVNHDLLNKAREEAQTAIVLARSAFSKQEDIATNTMNAAQRIVSSLRG